jgi:hypothetical protein
VPSLRIRNSVLRYAGDLHMNKLSQINGEWEALSCQDG